jgi:hypothetical protein
LQAIIQYDGRVGGLVWSAGSSPCPEHALRNLIGLPPRLSWFLSLGTQPDFTPNLLNLDLEQRWRAISEPGWEITERAFSRYHEVHGNVRNVLNCAIPKARAQQLTDFQMLRGWSADKCLQASGLGTFPEGLAGWEYTPKIRAEAQLPAMKMLPQTEVGTRSPWFQSTPLGADICLNARHLRYHHQLWRELRPQTLRGVHTTIVFVTPQLGFSLTPHIQLQKAFRYFAALSRAAGPVQLFPAKYIYPDANLGEFAEMPAPIFADMLPATGGFAYPILECTPDPWGVLGHFHNTDKFYGYPFSRRSDAMKDGVLPNVDPGAMVLPNGRRVTARTSESYVYATLDDKLHNELKCDREAFQELRALARGTITHDGLPFQLPVEMQCMVYTLCLTHWEMALDKAGELDSYTLKTRHAAIRGFNYFQRVEPYYTNFMRMIVELSKDPDFRTYPLSTHLTHNWLGGNVRISNQASPSEHELGPDLMRNYYLQQLDFLAGVFNLWNRVSFRAGNDLEKTISFDGLAMHQMRRLLRFDSHYFPRPSIRPSPWPGLHEGWLKLDRTGQVDNLPRI